MKLGLFVSFSTVRGVGGTVQGLGGLHLYSDFRIGDETPQPGVFLRLLTLTGPDGQPDVRKIARSDWLLSPGQPPLYPIDRRSACRVAVADKCGHDDVVRDLAVCAARSFARNPGDGLPGIEVESQGASIFGPLGEYQARDVTLSRIGLSKRLVNEGTS